MCLSVSIQIKVQIPELYCMKATYRHFQQMSRCKLLFQKGHYLMNYSQNLGQPYECSSLQAAPLTIAQLHKSGVYTWNAQCSSTLPFCHETKKKMINEIVRLRCNYSNENHAKGCIESGLLTIWVRNTLGFKHFSALTARLKNTFRTCQIYHGQRCWENGFHTASGYQFICRPDSVNWMTTHVLWQK